MKKAIIIGHTGQDGQLLFDLLKAEQYQLIGISSSSVMATHPSADSPIEAVDITNQQHIADLLKEFRPDEIYHLAAYHHSAQDATMIDTTAFFDKSYRVNVLSLLNLLEGVRLHSPATKLFYAASSHIFGNTPTTLQTETSALSPHTVYGIHKASGLLLCEMYRKNYGVFANVGILYNHESSLRAEKFVSRKIVKAAVRIKAGLQQEVELGDITAGIDWGYAPDFVRAMWLAMQQPLSAAYIIATGERHTVEDFVHYAFGELGLQWRDYVRLNADIITRNTQTLVGDSSKIRHATGWQPSVTFREMVQILIRNEQDTLLAEPTAPASS
jgi:GDPmannose 4,6-dehydratase